MSTELETLTPDQADENVEKVENLVADTKPSPEVEKLAKLFAGAFKKTDEAEIKQRDAFAACDSLHRTFVKGGEEPLPAWEKILVMVAVADRVAGARLVEGVRYNVNEPDLAKRTNTIRQYSQHSAWAKREGVMVGPSAAKRASMLAGRVADDLPEGVTFATWLNGQILPTIAEDGTPIPPTTTLGALLEANPSLTSGKKKVAKKADAGEGEGESGEGESGSMAETSGQPDRAPDIDLCTAVPQAAALFIFGQTADLTQMGDDDLAALIQNAAVANQAIVDFRKVIQAEGVRRQNARKTAE